MKHSDLKKAALSRPEIKAAYDALEPEFELLRQKIKRERDDGYQ